VRSTNRERSEVERGRDAGGTQHQQRPLGRHDQLGGPVQRLGRRQGQLDRVRKDQRHALAPLGGNVLREFQVNGAGALLLRNAKTPPARE